MNDGPLYSPDGAWLWDGTRWVPAPRRDPLWARPYASPDARAAAAVALLGLAVVASAVGFLGGGFAYLANLMAPPPTAPEALGLAVELAGNLAWLPGIVGCAIAVPMWMHRAVRNLPALGATGLGWSPAWAAGGWFVPGAFFVIPYLVARQLSTHAGGTARPAWPLLPVWWAAWLVATVLRAANLTVESVVVAEVVLLPYYLCLVLAGILMIRFVQDVTSRERARQAEIGGA